jgi:hypothetical protein
VIATGASHPGHASVPAPSVLTAAARGSASTRPSRVTGWARTGSDPSMPRCSPTPQLYDATTAVPARMSRVGRSMAGEVLRKPFAIIQTASDISQTNTGRAASTDVLETWS